LPNFDVEFVSFVRNECPICLNKVKPLLIPSHILTCSVILAYKCKVDVQSIVENVSKQMKVEINQRNGIRNNILSQSSTIYLSPPPRLSPSSRESTSSPISSPSPLVTNNDETIDY